MKKGETIMALRAVIFDLDDTLYTMRGLHELAAAHALELAIARGIDRDALTKAYARGRADVFARLDGMPSSHERLLHFAAALEILGINPYRLAPQMDEAYWAFYYDHMVEKPGMRQVLQNLRERGIKIAICSDMLTRQQCEKLCRLGIENSIDVLCCCDEVGYEKPDHRVYAYALQKLGMTKDEVVFVGDNIHKDVLGPLSFGMEAIWFNDYGQQAEFSGRIATDFAQVLAHINSL